MSKIQQIQAILGVEADGLWGGHSQAALDALIRPPAPPASAKEIEHHGKASSFADPGDIARFERCKAKGGTDHECFKVGDNGIGFWGDSTAEGTGPSCAVSPDDMRARWGSRTAAKHKPIEITANGKTITCILKDEMPAEENKANPAIIDLNPDAARLLGLKPPFMVTCSWRWT